MTTAHVLTAQEAHAVCCVLRTQHLPVTATVVDGVTYINPLRPLTTGEETATLRAFLAVTDAVAWHPTQPLAVAS